MPYLSFDLDAMERVGDVARLAKTTDAEVAWGLLRLWRMCWRCRRDVVTATELAGVFGVDGELIALALATFGFAEGHPDGVRVRGAERYLRIAKAQSEAGKRASGNLRQNRRRAPALRAGGEPVVEPEESRPASPALSTSSEQRAANKSIGVADANAPRLRPLTERLVAVYEAERGCRYKHGGAKDARALKALLSVATDAEIEARWRAGLASAREWTRIATLAQLAAKWNDLATGPPRGATAEEPECRLLGGVR